MALFRKTALVDPRVALTGRDQPILRAHRHAVFDTEVHETPSGSEVAYFALGCFWGEEKLFWQTAGVTNTAVGYMGGTTPNPTYEEVCSGRTNHTETVRVCFDPRVVSYADLVRQFFEQHDPTQGMRQGNDVGTQYRSAIFTTTDEQARTAEELRTVAQARYTQAGFGDITTEVSPAGHNEFYYAEDYHQQYLVKVPGGYCPNHATGVRMEEGWQSRLRTVDDLMTGD